MADIVALVGQATFIRGNVRGSGDLSVAGRIEGSVSIEGDVVFEDTALMNGDVTARRLVVRCPVKGNLQATEAIVLEAGARVAGDLIAPRISIDEGALVRGRVDTGTVQPKKAVATVAQAAAPAPAPAARPAARQAPAARPPVEAKPAAVRKPPAPAPAPAAPPPPPPAPPPVAATPVAPAPRVTEASAAAETTGPPPPVVPALKKRASAALKKRGATK